MSGAASGGGDSLSAGERAAILEQAKTGPWDDAFHEKHKALGRALAEEKLAALGKDELFEAPLPGGLRDCEWKRFFQEVSRPFMTIGGVDVADLKQGHVGDCYFVSAVAVVAQRGLVERNLVTLTDEGKRGLVCIRLLNEGEWRFIWMDDRVPWGSSRPEGMRSTEKREGWPCFVEKAWAILHGGYDNIGGGLPHQPLHALTGFPSERFKIKELIEEVGEEEAFDRLVTATNNGAIMCCTASRVEGTRKIDGIHTKHAYSFLGATRVKSGSDDLRLVKLRNPHAHGEWTGKFSDQDKDSWTPEIMAAMDHSPKESGDDGTFCMTFADMAPIYGSVYIAHPPLADDDGKQYMYMTLPFPLSSHSRAHPDKQFAIRPGRESDGAKLFISLTTWPPSQHDEIGLYLGRKPTKSIKHEDCIAKMTGTHAGVATGTVQSMQAKRTPYAIIPVAEKDCTAQIIVFSNKPLKEMDDNGLLLEIKP